MKKERNGKLLTLLIVQIYFLIKETKKENYV